MNKIRFCIVGTNFISDKFADAAWQSKSAIPYAVYSRKPGTGRAFADKHGIEKIYTDFSAMLSDGEIDAVYVASPTFLHRDHSVLALKAGKAVLCEKSIATSFEEFSQMKSASDCEGRVLLEAMRPQFDPAFKVIAESIPSLGKIRRAYLEFCKYSSRYDSFKRGIVENAFDTSLKNSALSDIGVYPLWLAIALFGEPMKISSYSVRLSNGFDGAGEAMLYYGDMVASVVYSKITESRNPSVIEGEEASLIIDKVSEPSKIIFRPRIGEERVIYSKINENNMVYEIEAFSGMVRGEADYKPYLEISSSVMKVMDSIIACQSDESE